MHELFVRPDGNPMRFHLADLNTEMETKYTLLIEDSGGKVEATANEKVMTFTIPDNCMKYKFVFNVQFIDDCIEHKRIWNISNYYLGDKRFLRDCKMSKAILGKSPCVCSFVKHENICKAIQNKMSTRYETLKSTVSQETKKAKNVPSKKRATVGLNIEKSKKMKQTTLKKSLSNKNKDEECSSRIIDETDSESEIEPSPRLNKTAGKKLRKVVHREISELSEPSTSKDKSDKKSVVILSSEDEADDNEPHENPVEEDVSIQLQNFIDETRKDKKIDKFGHPESSSSYYREKFEEWETRAMLRYLLIIDGVAEAKSPAVWKRLVLLRVLPRQKGYRPMLNYFKRVILPNIETYNLPPEALAKFQALGHPRNIIDT
ncbi:uncharacterized protein LOC117172816 [Belonocnema kinseyi]|uniref:uncharacterized protein LOC117172816 n=1 Tax=Belonocnema kinseyi TaxID=2817044 RepID=UPI00143CC2EB|nr:uncharacterized protein LOC117172816 [Belonocnema kinseyi]